MPTGESAKRIRLDASPSKRSVLNRAQAYAPDIAIFELIDNAVDRWREEGEERALDIDLLFEFDGEQAKRITIQDNAGGVARPRLEALVKPGVENPTPEAIGVWGEGLKVASLALGKEATFRTRYGEGPTYRIHWDEAWWEADDWTIYAQVDDEDIPSDSFEVTLTDLNQPLRRSEVFSLEATTGDPLVDRIGRTYAPILSSTQKPPVRIRVRETQGVSQDIEGSRFGDPDRLDEVFAFPPGYEPTRHVRTFPVPQDLRDEEPGGLGDRLKVEAIVGLMPEQSRDFSGVSMYGKGRLFAPAMKEGAVGFGTRGPAKIPASHPTTWRLLVLLYFQGPSAAIPWRAPTKEGYRENHPNHDALRSFIQDITLPYATFSKVAKRLDILPFSSNWNALSEADRRDEILSYCRQPDLVDAFFDDVPHLSGTFDPPPVREINHDRPWDDDELTPGLSHEQSKLVARFLKDRDVIEPRSLWGAPESPLTTLGDDPGSPLARDPDAPGPPARQRSLGQASRRDLEEKKVWEEKRRIPVALPTATIELLRELAPETSISSWVADLVDEAAGELDAVWQVPQREFRPIVRRVREEILEVVDDVEAIGLFGSVARGGADRESDIDLIVLHDDALEVQRDLNEHFKGFRFPAGKAGHRYTVRAEVLTPDAFSNQVQSGSATYQEIASQALWLHRAPGFDPPLRGKQT